MATMKNRKDSKGYVLKTGEVERKDGRYCYSYTDSNKQRHSIYAKSLAKLREREKELLELIGAYGLDEEITAFFCPVRLKGSGYALGNNDFRVNSGKGYNGSATYAVFKYDKSAGNMPEHDMAFLNHQYGTCTMQEAYVNNTYAVVDYVKNNFVDGDRLVLKATGYLNGSQTGQAEMVLADYSEKKDSLVVNWAKFDLQKLGNVQFVEFELAGTKDDMPTSVCIDDVVAKIALQY